MSTNQAALTDLVGLEPEDAVDQFRAAVASIRDPYVRDGLVRAFEQRTTSPLAEQVRALVRESSAMNEKLSQDTYRQAGVPSIAYDVIAKTFDGDHHDTEAVRAYAQEVGLVPTDPRSNSDSPAGEQA